MGLDSVFKLSVIVSMIDQLSGPIGRVNASVDNSASKLQKINQGFGDMAKTGLGIAGMGTALTAATIAPVKATFDTKRALGQLKSMGVEDFAALEEAATSFSNTWAGTSKSEFLSAAVDVKGGIDSLTDAGVAQYTEIAGLTAKATVATIDEMTSLFATGYGIYKGFYKDMSDLQFAEMFSAGLADSIRVFKASGSSMASSIQTLGAAATTAQVPLEEQLTVLGMLQATMSGSEAGTKYRAFLQSAAKAGQELKLKFTDANNQLLSMPEILSLLRGKFGETMDAAEKMQLQKAFGTDEAVALIDLLYSKTGDLQDNILTIYQSMGKGTAVAREMASAINETEPDRYEVLQQKIHNVTEQVGNVLTPTFNAFLNKTGQVVGQLGNWIGQHQTLTKYIALTILTLGILLTVAGTIITTIAGVGLIFTKTGMGLKAFMVGIQALKGHFLTIRIMALYAGDGIKAGFNGIAAVSKSAVASIRTVAIGMANFAKQAIMTTVRAMPGLIASVWSFTAALLANPITWIVLGIVALIAAIILLWQNWDAVTGWLQRAWNATINGIVAGFNWLRDLFAGMPLWLQIAIAAFFPFLGIPMLIINNWSSIREFFSNLIGGIAGIFSSGIQAAKDVITGALAWFRESGSKVISTFTEGIKSVINEPVDAVKRALSRVREFLPFSDAHEGPLSQLTLSGRRVFETIGTGMEQSEDIPAEATQRAFAAMDLSGDSVKKINLREMVSERSESSTVTTERNTGTVIQSLTISVDVSKLKDLPALFRLLKEIEDFTNGNGPTPSPA